LTDDKNRADDEIVQYEGGIPILKGRINDLENQARDAKYRDEKYKDAQLKLNGRLVWFTGVLALVGIIGGVLGGIQAHLANETLRQIKNGKADTTRIITASETQAIAANKIADAAESFSQTAGNAVDEFKKAATESASISKRAAKNAEDAMRISDQAYVTVTSPQFDLTKGVVSASVLNSGRIPSGPVDITAHYAVINMPIATEPTFSIATQSVEQHWRHTHFDSIPVGAPFTVNQALSAISQDMVNKSHQQIILVGFVSYGTGFLNTSLQKSFFCYDQFYNMTMKQMFTAPCDALHFLPQVEAVDGYPNNEEK
jgi:hypothetical protein